MIGAETNGIFYLLDEEGIFRTGERAPSGLPLAGAEGRSWVRRVREQRLATLYRTVRNQVLELLDIASLGEVARLRTDEEARRRASRRAYGLLGAMFGLDGTEREVIARVRAYSRTADGVIRFLRGGLLADYAPFIEMTNEIDMTSDPVELLIILFDDRYHRKARFEAKRKLVLMSLAAAIDQRERETRIEEKFRRFLDFLNEHVWSPDIRIGELESVYLVSRHDPEDFSCLDVRVVAPSGLAAVADGAKITLVKRRRFSVDGREVPIYVSVRKKPAEAKVLKLLRKRQENPAAAVDDEMGLMGVVDSVMDVKLFQRHLTRSAARAGSFLTLEDVDDTLTGGHHRGSNVGSDPNTRMLKFFARMGGMRVEFILHSNTTYLDYMYRRGTSHDEYEVKRLFDSGVAALLFPPDIYHLDLAAARDALLARVRRRIEER